MKNIQLLGTGLWDDPRVFASPALQGGLYAAPDPSGFRSFSRPLPRQYGADPVRTATLAYDAVALVAALARDARRRSAFSREVLTNPSGFAGIDGLFRFRADGTNERGLAVMKVTPRRGVRSSDGARRSARRADRAYRDATRATPPVLCIAVFAFCPGNCGRRRYAGQVTPPDRPTTASSTGKAGVRDAQAAVGRRLDDAPASRRIGDAVRIERAAGERAIARRVDALGETQAHQQELVGLLFAIERSSVTRPWPFASTRISQASGRFSVAVAWRAPSISRRPCAPGPMPAYSP